MTTINQLLQQLSNLASTLANVATTVDSGVLLAAAFVAIPLFIAFMLVSPNMFNAATIIGNGYHEAYGRRY